MLDSNAYTDSEDIKDLYTIETRGFSSGIDGQTVGKELWNFVLYMVTVARLLHAQRWKDLFYKTLFGSAPR